MNITLICKRFYTSHDLIEDRFGRLYHFPVLLSKNGFNTTVITADYRSYKNTAVVIEGVGFHSLSLRFLSVFLYLFGLIKILIKEKPDVIIASSDIHFGLIGYLCALLFRAKFVFDVYDHYYEFESAKFWGMKSLFHFCLRRADLIICASKLMLDFASKFNSQLLWLRNGADINVFKPRNRNELRSEIGIDQNQTVIGYFGALGHDRGIPVLIEACRRIKQTENSLILLLAGTKEESFEMNEAWIVYKGMVPQDLVSKLISVCDVLAIPYHSTLQMNYGNSCKIAEYLACSVPIVSTDSDNFSANYPELVERIGMGLCKAGSVESLEEAIRFQLKNKLVSEQPDALSWDSITDLLIEKLKEFQ